MSFPVGENEADATAVSVEKVHPNLPRIFGDVQRHRGDRHVAVLKLDFSEFRCVLGRLGGWSFDHPFF
jgi:hypothetical protein